MASNTVVQTNVLALNSHRNLGMVGAGKEKAAQRLSSGYRINSAADDAAGLAISEKMRAQIRGLDQSSRNAQDGISMIQTAEGAIQETQNILQRMRELVDQAANETLTTGDREKIALELNEMSAEIDSISSKSQFNTKQLIDGEWAKESVYLQTGANTNQGMKFNIAELSASGLNVTKELVGDVIADPSKQQKFTAGTKDEQNIRDLFIKDLGNVGSKAGTYKISDTESLTVDMDGTVTIRGFQGGHNGTYSASEFAEKFNSTTGTKVTSADGKTTLLLGKENEPAIQLEVSDATKKKNAGEIGVTGKTVTIADIADDKTDAKTYEFQDFNVKIGENSKVSFESLKGLDFIDVGNGLTLDTRVDYTEQDLKALGDFTLYDSSGASLKFTAVSAKFDFNNRVETSVNSKLLAGNATMAVDVTGADYTFGKNKITVNDDGSFTFKVDSAEGWSVSGASSANYKIEDGMTLTTSQLSAMFGGAGTISVGAYDISVSAGGTIMLQSGTGYDDYVQASGDYYDDTSGAWLDIDSPSNSATADTYDDLLSSGDIGERGILVNAYNGTAFVEFRGLNTDSYDITIENAPNSSSTDEQTHYTAAWIVDKIKNGDGIFSGEDLAALNGVKVTVNGSASFTFKTSADGGLVGIDATSSPLVTQSAVDASTITTKAEEAQSAGKSVSKAGMQGSATKSTGEIVSEVLSSIDAALETVSTQRAQLGAYQNRLEHTIKNLQVSSENLSAAESRVRDTDMAKEMMTLTKNNVLQQAAISMLAQANQQPQSILSLLQ